MTTREQLHAYIDSIGDTKWYALCDAHGGMPKPLAEADLTKSWVYDREYGVFPVAGGYHQQVMAMLYAWHKGFSRTYDLQIHLEETEGGRRKETSYLADKFIEEIPGTAFKSSVGKKVNAGARGSLTVIEKRFFGDITYIME